MILAHYQILEEIRNYTSLTMDGTVMTLEGTIMHPHSQEPFDEPDSNWPKMPKFGNFIETDTFVDSSSSVPKRKERTVTNDENIKSAGQDTVPIDSVVNEKLSTMYILKLHIGWFHIECVNLSKVEFLKHCENETLEWFCSECNKA
jgi:hypothetical protein